MIGIDPGDLHFESSNSEVCGTYLWIKFFYADVVTIWQSLFESYSSCLGSSVKVSTFPTSNWFHRNFLFLFWFYQNQDCESQSSFLVTEKPSNSFIFLPLSSLLAENELNKSGDFCFASFPSAFKSKDESEGPSLLLWWALSCWQIPTSNFWDLLGFFSLFQAHFWSHSFVKDTAESYGIADCSWSTHV